MSTISVAAPEAPPAPNPQPTGGTPPPLPRTPAGRMRPADLAILGASSGLIAALPLPVVVRAVALATFIAVGPGAAVLTWVHIPVRARPAVILVLGMSITTIVTIGAMWSYRWDPAGILTVGIVAITVSSGLWYRRNAWPRCRRPEIHWAREPLQTFLRHPSTLLSVLALILWAVSLPGLAGPDASLYGLLFSGTGPVLAVAMVITAAAFVVAIRSSYVPAAVLALGTAIIVERLTTTVATEMPLYDWTYKHVAVIDYIQVHNLIQPNGTDIYAQWPAFFVAMAWFCDVTGLSPLTLAHVWAPLIHVVIALVVFSAARVVKLSTRVALTAAFIVEIVNWVGQDYFSPQSWTLVLAYGLIVLLLTSRDCRAAGILAIVPFVAMVPTHQLTPFWVLLTTGLLVVTKRAKPWWTVLAMALVAGGYLLLNLQAVLPYGLLSGSSPVKNASSNFGDVVGSQAKWFTSAVCRSMSAGVVLSAMGAALILRRHRRAVLALCILAFSPLLLLLGQSYGGEAIFRVYLYGLVGIAILTAPILVWAIDRSRAGRFLAPAAATAWLAIVTLAGLNAYVALWPMIVQTREQFEVMEQITASAEPGVRIMMMHPAGMPTRIGEPYARQTLRDPDFDNPLSFGLYGEKATFPSPNQLGALEWALDQRPYDTFVLFSEQSDKAVQYYGEYRADAAARFKEYLSTAAGWTLVYRNGDTVVFRHIGSGKEKWKWMPAS